MKTLYIELFFIDNILINFYFLYLSGSILRMKINYKTGLMAAFLGALYGYFQLRGVGLCNLLICKLALSVIMVILSYYPYRTQFFLLLFCFYGLSFAFGGTILAIFLTSTKDSFVRTAMAIPIPLRFALIILLAGHFLKKYLLSIIAMLTYCKQGIFLRLTCFKEPVELSCYSDTGNTCTYFGKPVVFIDRRKISENFEETNKINGNISQQDMNIHMVYIPYKTAGGQTSTAPGFKCEAAVLRRGETTRKLSLYIALLEHDFAGEPCLVNPALLD